MSDYRGEPTPEGAESPRPSQLESIEGDLDTVDSALDALDSGDLEAAETRAAELGAQADDGSGPAREHGPEA